MQAPLHAVPQEWSLNLSESPMHRVGGRFSFQRLLSRSLQLTVQHPRSVCFRIQLLPQMRIVVFHPIRGFARHPQSPVQSFAGDFLAAHIGTESNCGFMQLQGFFLLVPKLRLEFY